MSESPSVKFHMGIKHLLVMFVVVVISVAIINRVDFIKNITG